MKAALNAGMIAAQLAPALLEQIAAGDGKKRGDSRLGCDQVIAGFMPLVLAHLVADREDLTVWIDEETKLRVFCASRSAVRSMLRRSSVSARRLSMAVESISYRRPASSRSEGSLAKESRTPVNMDCNSTAWRRASIRS